MSNELRARLVWAFTCFQRGFWVFLLLGVLLALARGLSLAIGHRMWVSDDVITSARVLIPALGNRGNNLLLLVHIATALPPLLLGLFLFLRGLLRTQLRPVHRWAGKVYVVSILISAVTGIVLATVNSKGPIAQTGFGTLGLAWFATTWMAYRKARAKDFVAHREWMIRSYSITLAVLVFPIIPAPAGWTAQEWYPMKTWLCWVPNLILGEMYLRATTFRGKLKWLSRRRPRRRKA